MTGFYVLVDIISVMGGGGVGGGGGGGGNGRVSD